MIPTPDSENGGTEVSEKSGQDFFRAAYIIAGGIILAAIIIAATMVHVAKELQNQVVLSGSQTQNTQQAAVQPATAGQAAQPSVAAGNGSAPVKITLAPNTPYLGSGTSKVTVVEFADYQCPFCEQFYKTVWPELKAKYVDTGKIKFVYQDFAFLGPDSNTAAEAAHCAADQNKFWQYHDYLFSNQQTENTGWATAVHQKQFAASLGLNTAQFNQCLDSNKYSQEVQNETAAGRSYGVTGTPTVFVNGVAIVGAQPASAFEQAIDAALK